MPYVPAFYFPMLGSRGSVPPPLWVPDDADGSADFVNGQYWDRVNGQTDFDTLFTFDRDDTAYAIDSNDDFTSFSTDEARITDLGLLYEAGGTYKISNPYSLGGTGWSDNNCSSAAYVGTFAALFTDARTVTSTGNANGGRQRDETTFFTDTEPVTFVVRYVMGTSGKFMARLINTSTFQASKISNSGGSSGAAATQVGTFSNIVDIEHDDHRVMVFTFTPNYTGTARIQLGPDSTSAGETCIAVGIEAIDGDIGLFSPFPSAGARAADDLTIHLGTDNYDLTLTFDDDSTQDIAGQTGDYALTTNLDRPRVKSIDWRRV